mmetsp:Transcript_8889/g.13269  ORF Transcript_8889/g.13269 Transcript_8889/m.13269 type:complete len:242 (-) Transcript_8889:67-792(-)
MNWFREKSENAKKKFSDWREQKFGKSSLRKSIHAGGSGFRAASGGGMNARSTYGVGNFNQRSNSSYSFGKEANTESNDHFSNANGVSSKTYKNYESGYGNPSKNFYNDEPYKAYDSKPLDSLDRKVSNLRISRESTQKLEKSEKRKKDRVKKKKKKREVLSDSSSSSSSSSSDSSDSSSTDEEVRRRRRKKLKKKKRKEREMRRMMKERKRKEKESLNIKANGSNYSSGGLSQTQAWGSYQ